MNKKVPYVLIIGSSNMDLNIYSEKFPELGETITGGTFKQYLGGKGANQSVAVVRSGAKTVFIGKIGVDSFGDQMISSLTKEGINTEFMIRDPKEPSGVAFILINKNGDNKITVAPGANSKLSAEEIKANADAIKNSSCVVVQMEIPLEPIKEIFNIASEGNVIKILNPAPLKPLPLEILEKVDIIIPNEGELYQLYSHLTNKELREEGIQKIVKASKVLTKMGIKCVITTLGSRGSIIYLGAEDKVIEIPTPEVIAVDTVGAGDCFIGVFASFLSKGEKIIKAVKFATIAASIAVSRKGAQNSMPYLNEIEEKMKELNIE
ncbi:MAG: ribokinase [Candidatus Lokiarchaeota archaeon]|nr:ribokinase [Candidatus Lokiarchaeota archaeon]